MKRALVLLLGLVGFLGLVGCSTSPSIPLLEGEGSETATSEASETSRVTVTTTISATVTISPTWTATRTNIKTSDEVEPSPSSTKFPVFDTALEYIEFLETITCEKPCFWGLEPGSSKVADFENITQPLEYFPDIEYWMSVNDDIIEFEVTIPDEDFYYHVNSSIESGIVKIINVVISNQKDPTVDLRSRPGEENSISDFYQEMMRKYQPSTLYSNWGIPDDIFIRTFIPAPSPQNWPTQTFFYYPDIGSVLTYINPTYWVHQENNQYVCLIDNPRIILWLFEPNPDHQVDDFLKLINSQYVYSLNTATKMNIEELMEIYKDAQNCQYKYIVLTKSDDYKWAPHYIQP